MSIAAPNYLLYFAAVSAVVLLVSLYVLSIRRRFMRLDHIIYPRSVCRAGRTNICSDPTTLPPGSLAYSCSNLNYDIAGVHL
jgi:hypothetical protein